MPQTPDNRGQRASPRRGADTIGPNTPVVPKESRSRVSMQPGPVVQGNRDIGFDTRSNTAWGAPKEQPYDAKNGARLVGDTMLAQEPKGRSKVAQDMDRFAGQTKSEQTGRPGALQFRIEDGNHAKRSTRE